MLADEEKNNSTNSFQQREMTWWQNLSWKIMNDCRQSLLTLQHYENHWNNCHRMNIKWNLKCSQFRNGIKILYEFTLSE